MQRLKRPKEQWKWRRPNKRPRLTRLLGKRLRSTKKAKVSAARQKQLELLSQCKVAVRIAWVEEAQRVSEASEEVMPSGIMGYGKGKALEKHIYMNCLRKGVECEWDEGG